MKKLKYLMIVLFFVLFITPITAKENNDFNFNADDSIVAYKNISGSVFNIGNDIEMNSDVDGIGFLFGKNININNKLSYLITAGNNINIYDEVVNDAFIIGNVVNISKSSLVGRDLIIIGNEVNISGNISRNVKIYASKVNIKGSKVSGKVKLSASNIFIDKQTKINNELSYNDDAKVNIETKDAYKVTPYKALENKIVFKDVIFSNAISYASMLLIFLVLALTIPKAFEKINKNMDESNLTIFFKLFIIGFFSLIIIPFLVILLFTSIIGVSLGFLLLALYIISICLVNVFVSYIIGRLILNKLLCKEENILLSGFVGMIVLYVLSLIPYINFLVSFISLFIGLGLILTLINPKNKMC